MDLLETLHDELKDRHFSEEEKMLYIYLRTCQEFSFDDRFFYLDFSFFIFHVFLGINRFGKDFF